MIKNKTISIREAGVGSLMLVVPKKSNFNIGDVVIFNQIDDNTVILKRIYNSRLKKVIADK